MSMVDRIDSHANWLEREADKADASEDSLRADISDAWSDCLKQRDIDANIGGGYYGDLIEVMNDACSDGDQTINRTCMQALVHCAAKGQIEAEEALQQVKAFFVEKTLEFHKSF